MTDPPRSIRAFPQERYGDWINYIGPVLSDSGKIIVGSTVSTMHARLMGATGSFRVGEAPGAYDLAVRRATEMAIANLAERLRVEGCVAEPDIDPEVRVMVTVQVEVRTFPAIEGVTVYGPNGAKP